MNFSSNADHRGFRQRFADRILVVDHNPKTAVVCGLDAALPASFTVGGQMEALEKALENLQSDVQ